MGNEIIETLTPDFTTTDINIKLVCQLSIMDSFKKYFDFEMTMCVCGIPYIILEGVADDYKKIISKAKNLSKYDFEWYIEDIIPIIQKMVDAKEGKIDIEFFKNMILKKEVLEDRSEFCRPPKLFKVDYINGWIVKFFGYLKDGKDQLFQFSSDKINRETINILPSQILNIPFKIINPSNKKEKEMKFEAGIFGCALNEKKEISLGIGWLVSPLNSPKKGMEEDEQFDSLKETYYHDNNKNH